MNIGYVQFNPQFGKKKENFTQVDNLLKDKKADLIVLPELFATGYTFTSKEEARSLAETANGITFQFLKELSFKTEAVIVGGFVEQKGQKIYNSSLTVFQDKFHETYQKIHLFNKEKIWFSPGEEGFKVFEVNGIHIGIMICFDWIFPESARSLALQGADIIAHPSNLVLPYCQDAMKIRCLENHIFAITANRFGQEKRGSDDFAFTGQSQITNYDGTVLSKAPNKSSFTEIIDIDPSLARDKTLNNLNNLFNDRKPKLYVIK
jgi:predicted amidohydrolase